MKKAVPIMLLIVLMCACLFIVPIFYLAKKGTVTESHLNSPVTFYESGDKGFAWDLNNLMPKDGNYMYSPLSVKMALAMAATGANGETKDEILTALGISDLDEFNEFAKQIIRQYKGNKNVKLSIANSIWLNTKYDKSAKFSNTFKNTVRDYYDAESREVNYLNAVKTINNWVKNKTGGKIKDIAKSNDFLACLVNAIYFQGEWTEQFQKRATHKDEFTDRNGKKTQIDFMNRTGYVNYYGDYDIQIVELPYTGGNISMYIAILDSKDSNPSKYIKKMESKKVKMSIPKFKIEFMVNLNNLLAEMDINAAFDMHNADFGNMFTQITENAYISDVIHKTFIEVDEKGTEASAATFVMELTTAVALPEEPIIFKADRPFTYFIRDNSNDEILFMGEYAYIE